MCLLRVKQHVTNEKNTKNLEKVEIVHCWHTMYSILSTFLFIRACKFYNLSERGQFNKEQKPILNLKSQNIDTNPIHLLVSMC